MKCVTNKRNGNDKCVDYNEKVNRSSLYVSKLIHVIKLCISTDQDRLEKRCGPRYLEIQFQKSST